MPTAHTRVFAILGDPVAHSRSPVIQNAAIARAGIDATYVALRCSSAELPGLVLGLARAGGGGNVTIPHKGRAATSVEVPSARVRATRACNTYWLRRGRVHGENTDVPAFGAAVQMLLGDIRGARALLLGAGGAARAAVHSLLENAVGGITVLGRSRARAREIMNVAGRRARRVLFSTDPHSVRGEGYDVVINATPLGLHARDPLPFRLGQLGGVRAVFDMAYKTGGTRWVEYAASLGIPAMDGSEMLVRQAAAAFELWFDVEAPLELMRETLHAASAREAS